MTVPLDSLSARMAAEDTVVRMFVATDERDWARLEDCFTDPSTLDMTSMVGGAPTTMSPRDVARAWAEGFAALDHVHHQVGNFRTTIAPGQAFVQCYGVAFHHRSRAAGQKTRVFVGAYELLLIPSVQRWQISQFTFKLKFIDGNLDLEKA